MRNYKFLSTLLTFSALLVLASCKKSGNDCLEPKTNIITTNSPVVEGWPLRLESNDQTFSWLYKWSGPNGWSMNYETFASDAYLQERMNMTMADAGEYTLTLISAAGCVVSETKVMVEVIKAPNPPCNITANTSTSSVAGVGDYNFVYRNFLADNGHFLASGRETVPGGDIMRFAFVGNVPPKPGIYSTNGYFGMEVGKVGLYIGSNTMDFVAHPDQNVYVTKVNNKLQISFCSLKFNNPMNPSSPITVSAKLVEP